MSNDIAKLEEHITKLKEANQYAEEVQKLMKTPLFIKVILEDFCVKSAARYIQESGDPLLPDNQRADALAIAQAGGHLKRWLDITLRMAETNLGSIQQCEDQIQQILEMERED